MTVLQKVDVLFWDCDRDGTMWELVLILRSDGDQYYTLLREFKPTETRWHVEELSKAMAALNKVCGRFTPGQSKVWP